MTVEDPNVLGLVILSAGLVLKGSDHDCPAYPASKWSFNPDTLENQAQAQDLMTMRLAKSVPDVAFAVSSTRQNFIDEFIFDRLAPEGVDPAGSGERRRIHAQGQHRLNRPST